MIRWSSQAVFLSNWVLDAMPKKQQQQQQQQKQEPELVKE